MSFSRQRYKTEYSTIRILHEEKFYSINWMCRKLKLSRAGYYKYLEHKASVYESETLEIAALVKEYDEHFGHILGYRRMTEWINRFNSKTYSKKRIHNIMKKLGIRAAIRKQKKKFNHSNTGETADNLLNRNFYAAAPNEKWATDVTEFKIPDTGRKLYLSVIIDLYDRYPVAYEIGRSNNNQLVLKTFEKAVAENPEARPIFHSDRGFQYTSKVFGSRLQKHGMKQSMSRAGCCIDNGVTEGFWGIIKTEMFQMYKIHDEASLRHAITEYIRFYSEERIQGRYKGKTPLEVRIENIDSINPEGYPIPVNKRIQKYKAKWSA